MNASGQSFLRKAMRLFGAGVPMTLASDELFAIRPGASIPAMLAYGPAMDREEGGEKKHYRMLDGGVAEIAVTGVLSKHPSLFRIFGCSDQPTLGELTEAVNCAAMDEAVGGVLLYFETPGGTVAGTPEFADAVAACSEAKPVHAFTPSLCASAGYWPASRANRITAGRAAEVGSIGVFSVMLDASKAAGMMGLRFHVIASGPFKGAGVEPGAGLTPEQLEYFQGRVDDTAELFIADIAAGRSLALSKARVLADGRCHIASRALSLGLIDAVGTYEEALETLRAAIASPPQPMKTAPPPPPEPEPHEHDEPLPPEEEPPMSEKAKADASAAEEDTGLLAKIKALLAGTPTKEAAATSAAAVQPAQAGLSAEDVKALVKAGVDAGLQVAAVERDLEALADRVPPAVRNDPETKALLLDAKAKGPERYKRALALVAGIDASALLGAPVAGSEQTGEAHVGLGVNARELSVLKALGMDAQAVASIEQKFDLRKVN